MRQYRCVGAECATRDDEETILFKIDETNRIRKDADMENGGDPASQMQVTIRACNDCVKACNDVTGSSFPAKITPEVPEAPVPGGGVNLTEMMKLVLQACSECQKACKAVTAATGNHQTQSAEPVNKAAQKLQELMKDPVKLAKISDRELNGLIFHAENPHYEEELKKRQEQEDQAQLNTEFTNLQKMLKKAGR